MLLWCYLGVVGGCQGIMVAIVFFLSCCLCILSGCLGIIVAVVFCVFLIYVMLLLGCSSLLPLVLLWYFECFNVLVLLGYSM